MTSPRNDSAHPSTIPSCRVCSDLLGVYRGLAGYGPVGDDAWKVLDVRDLIRAASMIGSEKNCESLLLNFSTGEGLMLNIESVHR